MKIKLLSDLHLEFSDFTISYDGEDILILAGDISPSFESGLRLVQEYLKAAKNSEVILVLGNHDYYHSDLNTVEQKWRNVRLDHFHYLQNDSVVIKGTRFYGTTLWTDMNNADERSMAICKRCINDFYKIKDFTPPRFVATHLVARQNLKQALENSPEPVIVVTHHLPSYKSIAPKYAGCAFNPGFACTDMDDLVQHPKVKLWCHGHTHQNVDYFHGATRVVCNPRGYVQKLQDHEKRENQNFNGELILELNT